MLALNLNNLVSFARGEEEIRFKTILAGVKVIVPTVESIQSLVVTTFDNFSLLNDEDLVGAPNR